MEQTAVDAVIKLLQTVGFPVLVCGWFMFRMEKRLDQMIGLLEELLKLLAKGG